MRLSSLLGPRLAALSVVVILCGTTKPLTALPPALPTVPQGTANTSDNQAYYRPEVRLRKLHLVRPDLIPYPIAYEVYC